MFRQKLFDIVSCIHFRKTCDLMLEISKIRFIVIRYRSNDALKNWIEFLSNAFPNLLIVFPRKNPSSPLPLDKKWQFFFRTRDRCNERFRENSSWYSLDSEERFVKMRWLSVSHVTVAVSADLSPLSSLVSVLCFPLWTRFVVPVV